MDNNHMKKGDVVLWLIVVIAGIALVIAGGGLQ
jgi:hypothetical protein